ncbi:hypothetical protein ACSBR1_013354 [Camellia fascicularis]
MVRRQGIMEIPPQAELRLTLGSLMTFLGPSISKHCDSVINAIAFSCDHNLQFLFNYFHGFLQYLPTQWPQKHLTCPTKTRGALKIYSYSLLIDGIGWLLPYIRVYNKVKNFLDRCKIWSKNSKT